MRILLTILSLLKFAYGLNVKNLANLRSYTGTATEIVVMDSREAGTFYRYTGTDKADGGVIVADGKGRLWLRSYSIMLGVNAEWWPGMVNDRLDAATKYCIRTGDILNLTDHVLKFSRPWIIGVMSISASDSKLFEAYNQDAPTYNLAGVISQNSLKPFSIRGRNTIIVADFTSTELQPVIAYCLWGVNADKRHSSAKIEGLIIASELWDNRIMPVTNKKHVGLLLQRTTVDVEDVQFHGFETGLLINASYGGKIISPVFTYCKTGFLPFASHSYPGFNLWAEDCELAYDIQSGATTYKQLNTERCEQSLKVRQGFNHFDGVYFEGHSDKFQIEIGEQSGYPVMGTIISAMTIAAPHGIILQPSARGLTINGSNMVSAGTHTTSELNIIWVNNSFQDIPRNLPGKLFVDGKQLNLQ